MPSLATTTVSASTSTARAYSATQSQAVTRPLMCATSSPRKPPLARSVRWASTVFAASSPTRRRATLRSSRSPTTTPPSSSSPPALLTAQLAKASALTAAPLRRAASSSRRRRPTSVICRAATFAPSSRMRRHATMATLTRRARLIPTTPTRPATDHRLSPSASGARASARPIARARTCASWPPTATSTCRALWIPMQLLPLATARSKPFARRTLTARSEPPSARTTTASRRQTAASRRGRSRRAATARPTRGRSARARSAPDSVRASEAARPRLGRESKRALFESTSCFEAPVEMPCPRRTQLKEFCPRLLYVRLP
mmetsp:Transcript_6549/g.14278  ORF Transcript_6549/g.14278 Transcript_6549/m.14278 type:complete len:317 (-) Transcript_6549:512-1462(-)